MYLQNLKAMYFINWRCSSDLYVFYYAKGVFLEFNDQNAKDYSGYYYRSLPKKGNKKGLEIEYKDNTKKSTPYYPISNAKEAINFLIEK